MIHHDYLLRLIEQMTRALANISELRRGQDPQRAAQVLDQELARLLAADRREVLRLSTTELLARIARTGAVYEVRTKAMFLVGLLKESGELAVEAGEETEGRESLLRALRLLLEVAEQPDPGDCPQLLPTVDALVNCLAGAAIPSDTQALLMRHYERAGEFAKAEDALFALLETEPPSPALLEFGTEFYRRLLALSDATLAGGDLCRDEIHEGLAELRRRAVA